MPRSASAGLLVFLLCVVTTTSDGLAQESPPPLDLGIRLTNPSLLGLDETAYIHARASSGFSFAIGSTGMEEIPVKIVPRRTTVSSKASLERFLSENGILPDSQAYSFVYYLNPDLASIPEIATDTTLELPVFQIPTIERLPRRP